MIWPLFNVVAVVQPVRDLPFPCTVVQNRTPSSKRAESDALRRGGDYWRKKRNVPLMSSGASTGLNLPWIWSAPARLKTK